jgi:thiol-disulfide isomerase/thioredoxin
MELLRIKFIAKFIFTVSLFVIISCNNQNLNSEISSKNTVLIFKNASDHSMFTFPSGSRSGILPVGLISFVGRNGIPVEYTPSKSIDTLVIPDIPGIYLEVLHKFQGLEEIYFLFKVGDTIEISYDEFLYPWAKSFSSDGLTEHYNFNSGIRDRKDKFGFESFTLLKSEYVRRLHNFKIEKPYVYETELKSIHINYVDVDSVKINFKRYQERFKYTLDSHYEDGRICSAYFGYYRYMQQIMNIYYSICEYRYGTGVELLDLDSAYRNLFNDSLIYSISYQRLLKDYLHDVLYKGNKVDQIRTGNAQYYDTRQVFESVKSDTSFTPKMKDILLFYCMVDIIENFSSEDIKNHLSDYNMITADSTKIQYLITHYKLNFEHSDDLILADVDGSYIGIKDLLDKYNDKVVYISFWASWCAPCRASMADALNLRTHYSGEEVVFIYLAFNDKENDWKESIPKLGLDVNCLNYIIVNPKTSAFLDDYKIKSVPRYMLYSKKGEVIHHNAPGPKGSEISKLLDKYIIN